MARKQKMPPRGRPRAEAVDWPAPRFWKPELTALLTKLLNAPGDDDELTRTSVEKTPQGRRFKAHWMRPPNVTRDLAEQRWRQMGGGRRKSAIEHKEVLYGRARGPQWDSQIRVAAWLALVQGVQVEDPTTAAAAQGNITQGGQGNQTLMGAKAFQLELWPVVAHPEAYERAEMRVKYSDADDFATVANDQYSSHARQIVAIDHVYGKPKPVRQLTEVESALAYAIVCLHPQRLAPNWLVRANGRSNNLVKLDARDADVLRVKRLVREMMRRPNQGDENSDDEMTQPPSPVESDADEPMEEDEPLTSNARSFPSITGFALPLAKRIMERPPRNLRLDGTTKDWIESDLNKASLPFMRFAAYLTNEQALSGGCIRCMRPFYEPSLLWVRDDWRSVTLSNATKGAAHAQSLTDARARSRAQDVRARLQREVPANSTLRTRLLGNGALEKNQDWPRLVGDPTQEQRTKAIKLPAGLMHSSDPELWLVTVEHLQHAGEHMHRVYSEHRNTAAAQSSQITTVQFGSRERDYRLMRYDSWQAQSNLCTDCGHELRKANLLDDREQPPNLAFDDPEVTEAVQHSDQGRDLERLAQETGLTLAQVQAAADEHDQYVDADDRAGLSSDNLTRQYARAVRAQEKRGLRPTFNAATLLRMGILDSEQYARALFRQGRGEPTKAYATVDVTVGDATTGLAQPVYSEDEARKQHMRVVDECGAILRGETVESPSLTVTQALSSLALQHYTHHQRIANARDSDGNLMVPADLDDPNYEYHRVVKHVKTEEMYNALVQNPDPKRSEQARSIQQSKFLLTLVQHRRATRNEAHNQHIMLKMAESARRLFREPAELAGIFKCGMVWKKDHYEVWRPRKRGGDTTGVGHYISEKFPKQEYETILRRLGENDGAVHKLWITNEGQPYTVGLTEPNHPYSGNVKGTMLLPDEYASDYIDDILKTVRGTVGVEIGPVQRLFHFHCVLDVKHIGKLQLDNEAFKNYFHACWLGAKFEGEYRMQDVSGRDWILPQERLHLDNKLQPEDHADAITEAYVKKSVLGFRNAQMRAMKARLAKSVEDRMSDASTVGSHALATSMVDRLGDPPGGSRTIGDGRPQDGPRDSEVTRNRPATGGPRGHAVFNPSNYAAMSTDQQLRDEQAQAEQLGDTAFERERQRNIERNNAELRRLGLL